MKTLQSVALGGALCYTFYHWIRKEKMKEKLSDEIDPAEGS
ncbi:hypothetical protein BSNK01_23740 [Bacillaceae bacterium]